MKKYFSAALCFVLLYGTVCAEKELRKKYAVSIVEMEGENSDVKAAAIAELEAMFTKMGYFDIVERGKIQNVLEEQKFSASGVVSADKAIALGNLIGADLLVYGNIVSYEEGTEQTTDSRGKIKELKVVTINLAVKIISVETGVVEFSETQGYTRKGEQYSVLVSECLKDITEDFQYKIMNAFPRRAYIIKVDGDIATLDSGRSEGLYKGMRFDVYTKGDNIVHPVTGEIIAGKRKKVGEAKIKDVDENISEASISGKVAPGMYAESRRILKPAKWEFAVNYAQRPFNLKKLDFNLIYYDGYDLYPIRMEQDKLTSVPAPGITLTRFFSVEQNSRVPVSLSIDYLANSPLYGLSADLSVGYEFDIAGILKAEIGIGGFYTLISGKAGQVGYGSNTGANFMYGPDSEIIPYGNDINLEADAIGGLAKAGFLLPVSEYFGFRIDGGMRVATKADNWKLTAKDRDDKDVTLAESSFRNLTDLGSLTLDGAYSQAGIYFRY